MRNHTRCDRFALAMQLELLSLKTGNVIVIRCQGRLVVGEEVTALQSEIDKRSLESKRFVLHLGEVNYLDSGGLGALVRIAGSLRAFRGDLKLCELSKQVAQILQVTNLHSVFRTYASEDDAITAFSDGPHAAEAAAITSKKKVVCVDPSTDLLAYLNALLRRAGYEVFTSRHVSDAVTLVRVTRPSMIIGGPGLHANPSAIEKLRPADPHVHLLMLESNYSTTEAEQAGSDLLSMVHTLLGE
jgi:anti-sigma B factor antagonist